MRVLLAAIIAITFFTAAAPALAVTRGEVEFNVREKLDTVANPSYKIADDLGESTIAGTIGKAINLGLALLGTVAVILLIYAGYLWMMSGGNEEQVSKAKTIIKQVVVGLIVLSLAYAIVTFAVSFVDEATKK